MSDSVLQREIGQTRPFPNRETEVYLNLQRTQSLLIASTEELLNAHGLTGVLYNVLRILRGAGKPLPCSTVSKRLLTRVPDLTRLSDRLVRKGLVERIRTEEDRRLVMLSLTAEGERLLKELDAPIEQLSKDVLGHMSASELDQLNQLLVKARKNVRR